MDENTHSFGVKENLKEEIFFLNLLGEPTVRAAAAKTGISEATAYRWVKNPEFRKKYREACLDAVQMAIHKLQLAVGPSVDILLEVILDRKSPANARVNAVRAVWEIALKGIAFENMLGRIEQLEQKLEVDDESQKPQNAEETDTENTLTPDSLGSAQGNPRSAA